MATLLAAVVGLSLAAAPPAAGKPDAGSAAPRGDEALWAVLGNFDEYPGATPYQLADEMVVGQANLRMVGFTTADPPEQVVEFYRAEFKREKLFIPNDHPPGLPFSGITAFSVEGNLEKTVMVLPGAGGPTRVVLSISPGTGLTGKSLEAGGDPPAGLPVYPVADKLYRTDATDRNRMSSTISYLAGADPAKVLDYIRKELSSKGWNQAKEQGDPGGGLRYVRTNEAVEITLLPLGEAGTEVTYVYQH
jgi:hypothetical protein